MATKTVTGNPIEIFDAAAGSYISFSGVKNAPSSSLPEGSWTTNNLRKFNDIVITHQTSSGVSNKHILLSDYVVSGSISGNNFISDTFLRYVNKLNYLSHSFEYIPADSSSSTGLHFGSFQQPNYSAVTTNSFLYYPNGGTNTCYGNGWNRNTNTAGIFGQRSGNVNYTIGLSIETGNSIGITLDNINTASLDLLFDNLIDEILYWQLRANPVTEVITPPDIVLAKGYNKISSGELDSITISYNVATWSVNLPNQMWSASPSTAAAGTTITLTYSGEVEPQTVNVIGVSTMQAVTLTKTSSNTWTFVMPTEDVGVNVDLKKYANIEIIQSAGGIITADKTIAYDGDVVTLTFVPNENYEFMSTKVTKNARDVETTKVSNNQYQFTVHIQ